MSGQPAEMIRGELSPDERLLWAGRPRLGAMLRPVDVFLIPISLLWGGMAVFWETQAITEGAPFIAMLMGVPFVRFGLYFIVGRFWVDAKQRSRTFYGVSSQRVIISSGLYSRRVKSLNLDTLTDL